MAKNKKISGIFSDLLESVAIWFLYIFVDARANVPNAILQKRKKQIDWLTLIDKINPVYDFNQLVAIVQNGITKRYGVSPATLLSQLYNTANSPAVGSTTLEQQTAKAQAEAKALALQNIQVSTSDGKKNIWSEIESIISALVSLFSGLGIVKSNSEIKTYTPAPNDWVSSTNTSSASMGMVVPVLLTGGIIYYLATANGAKKNKK